MRDIKKIVFFLLFFGGVFGSGCLPSSGIRQQPEGVRMAEYDPPRDCKSLGPLKASAEVGDHAGAKRKLREIAAKKGANYIRLEGITDGFNYVGTMFYCAE